MMTRRNCHISTSRDFLKSCWCLLQFQYWQNC
jgi:hypothetical protein